MRTQWRLLLLLRSHSRRSQLPDVSRLLSHSHFLVQSLRSFSSGYSILHSRAPTVPLAISFLLHSQNPSFRCFSSSELAVEHNKESDHAAVLTDIFSKDISGNDQIKLALESHGIVICHETVLKVLQNLDNTPDVARTFFNWVLESESERLSSKSYNLMLGILGVNGFVKEFWDMVGIMKKKGYGVSKGTYIRVLEKFEKEGLEGDVGKLKGLFASGPVDASVEKVCSRVCEVIQQEVWGEDVEKRLRELNVVFLNDLVAMVLENLGIELNKALLFFRWIEESGLFKHDEQTYNAMVRVLGKEEYTEKFWKVVNEMRGAGFKIEKGTYVSVLSRFVRRKMITDAVDLYEMMMIAGACKPSQQDCTFLLKKIVVGKELDMDLFSKVVRVFKASGNVFTNSTLDAVLKSLTSVGRLGECNKILRVLEEGGLQLSATLQRKIAFQLSSRGKTDEASEFMNYVEMAGCGPSYRTWASLIEGHCVAGDLDKGSNCLQEMVEKEGTSYAGFVLELLVNAYCKKNRAMDACKLFADMVKGKELKPWHTTYKVLLSKLLIQEDFKEALNLLPLMKTQGYPPFLDPFIEFISKTGTTDDAVMFLKVLTVKRLPSTSVFHRIFEAYFKAGRHSDAQDFLSKCPRHIRNHADVLSLFCSMRSSGEATGTTSVAA